MDNIQQWIVHSKRQYGELEICYCIYTACYSFLLIRLQKSAQPQSKQTRMCCNADGFFIALHEEGQRGNIASILVRVCVSAASSQNAWSSLLLSSSPPMCRVLTALQFRIRWKFMTSSQCRNWFSMLRFPFTSETHSDFFLTFRWQGECDVLNLMHRSIAFDVE